MLWDSCSQPHSHLNCWHRDKASTTITRRQAPSSSVDPGKSSDQDQRADINPHWYQACVLSLIHHYLLVKVIIFNIAGSADERRAINMSVKVICLLLVLLVPESLCITCYQVMMMMMIMMIMMSCYQCASTDGNSCPNEAKVSLAALDAFNSIILNTKRLICTKS